MRLCKNPQIVSRLYLARNNWELGGLDASAISSLRQGRLPEILGATLPQQTNFCREKFCIHSSIRKPVDEVAAVEAARLEGRCKCAGAASESRRVWQGAQNIRDLFLTHVALVGRP